MVVVPGWPSAQLEWIGLVATWIIDAVVIAHKRVQAGVDVRGDVGHAAAAAQERSLPGVLHGVLAGLDSGAWQLHDMW